MAFPIENLHPRQIGAFRLKFRRDRGPGLSLEPAWSFYPKYAWEVARAARSSTRKVAELTSGARVAAA